MKILSILACRGGCGATTLAISLAAAAVENGRNALLIALEDYRQESGLELWGKARATQNSPLVLKSSPFRLADDIVWARSEKFDLVIIDTTDGVGPEAHAAVSLSDFVLIPARDIGLSTPAVEQVRSLGKGYAVVVTLFESSEEGAPAAEQDLRAQDIEICPVRISRQRSYAAASMDGVSVLEYEPAGKAASDVWALYGYINDAIAI